MKYRTIFCCLLAIAAAPALAQDTDFVVEDEAMLCAGCHGEDGVPMESDDPVPIIWGQEYFYVLTQLRDYGAGRREHDVMTGIAAQYSRDEAGKLAEYFVAKEWPYIQGEAQDGDQAIAERAATGGLRQRARQDRDDAETRGRRDRGYGAVSIVGAAARRAIARSSAATGGFGEPRTQRLVRGQVGG